MKNELDVFRDVSHRLEKAGIKYMLTGSLAMNCYASPRMTRDIDIVIELVPDDVTKVIDLFAGDYYVSREAVVESVRNQSLFNIIENDSVIKVDFIIRKRSAYRLNEFDRRQRTKIADIEAWVVSKEDLILSKLDWAKDSHSDFQLRDVRNLVATGCDRSYIRGWTDELGVTNLWKELFGND